MRSGADFGTLFTSRHALQASEDTAGTWAGAFRGAEPALKAAARTQLELMTFASKRAQATLAIPTRLATCRTPNDLVNEQVKFWQTAFEQYAETTRHIAAFWSGVNPAAQMMAQTFESWQQQNAASKAEAAKPVNDLITFPEPKIPSQREPQRENELVAA